MRYFYPDSTGYEPLAMRFRVLESHYPQEHAWWQMHGSEVVFVIALVAVLVAVAIERHRSVVETDTVDPHNEWTIIG